MPTVCSSSSSSSSSSMCIFLLGGTSFIGAQIIFTLNLSDITSKFCTVSTLVIVRLQTIFAVEFVDMVTICHHTKFNLSISNGLLVITYYFFFRFKEGK